MNYRNQFGVITCSSTPSQVGRLVRIDHDGRILETLSEFEAHSFAKKLSPAERVLENARLKRLK